MIVETTSGRIQGCESIGSVAFLGVPYAAPIMPGRRFLPPQDVSPWTGIRSATTLSEVCPQIATYGPVGTGATSALQIGEDFLTLNIRTPSLTGSAPVLVWIHGGGYAVGSANEPILQTGAFSASGIVEVTVNYRLGAMGFLYIDDDTPTNRGLLDQIKALEWVRDNIAKFGGDPTRVTLAGRSAGGFSVATLMAMPSAKGLFTKALVQSGATPAILTKTDATRVAARLLARLGTDDLEHVPIKQLLMAQRDICNESYTCHDFARDGAVTIVGTPFQPIVEKNSLPVHPEDAARVGQTHQAPMMIGCTSAEYLTHSTAHHTLSQIDAARLLDPRVRPLGLSGPEIVARYASALPKHDGIGLWRAIGGDLVFQNPSTRFARLHGRYFPVYKYLYGAIEPNETGERHGAEVGAVWYREGPGYTALSSRYHPSNLAFAKMIHELWVSFIEASVPTLPGNLTWPSYAEGAEVILRMERTKFYIASDPFSNRTDLWKV